MVQGGGNEAGEGDWKEKNPDGWDWAPAERSWVLPLVLVISRARQGNEGHPGHRGSAGNSLICQEINHHKLINWGILLLEPRGSLISPGRQQRSPPAFWVIFWGFSNTTTAKAQCKNTFGFLYSFQRQGSDPAGPWDWGTHRNSSRGASAKG